MFIQYPKIHRLGREEVKKELFDRYVRDKYNIRFVLDDRDRVVKMWRNEIGLKVLQVAEGAF